MRCFIFLLPNYFHVYANTMQRFVYLDKMEVLPQEYSQPLILPSPHFRWVVKIYSIVHRNSIYPKYCNTNSVNGIIIGNTV